MGRSTLGLWIGFLMVAVSACSGGGAQPAKDVTEKPVSGEPSAPKEPTGALARLQGTWEIVRYQSDYPVPDQAMSLMSELFDSLRLRFLPDHAMVGTSKTTEERMAVAIEEESGERFKLHTDGGMFDGAECRFLGPDEWEVTDRGKNWPGVSVIRRVKP